MKNLTIAIDGPAGAGKSTIAKLLAEKLGYIYIDTGAMYRSVAYLFLKNQIPLEEEKVAFIAQKMNLEFRNIDNKNRVFVDGKDISDEIRSYEVTKIVSSVAAINDVRTCLVEKQRKLGENGNVVMDGRDIGTVVFPQADLKIFLNASVETRAKRRYNEIGDETASYEELVKDISKRDKLDMEREISPLRKAEDAIEIDTTNMNIDEVVSEIYELIKRV